MAVVHPPDDADGDDHNNDPDAPPVAGGAPVPYRGKQLRMGGKQMLRPQGGGDDDDDEEEESDEDEEEGESSDGDEVEEVEGPSPSASAQPTQQRVVAATANRGGGKQLRPAGKYLRPPPYVPHGRFRPRLVVANMVPYLTNTPLHGAA